MNSRVCFIIFAHCNLQVKEDLDDMISNINQFHNNCDFLVNHPNIQHEKIFTRHILSHMNDLNKPINAPFIFGAFKEIINKISYEEINA